MLVKIGTEAMMKLRIQVERIKEITTFRLKKFAGKFKQLFNFRYLIDFSKLCNKPKGKVLI